jgi:DNA invertase Pin-like site-specific DNA recombinase
MYGRSGSDGVPSFTLDQNSSSTDKENWLYQKHKLLDPIPDYTTSSKKLTKLKPNQQQEIIAQHATGQSLRELARAFGVSYETIRTTIKRHNNSKTNSENYSKPEAKGDF